MPKQLIPIKIFNRQYFLSLAVGSIIAAIFIFRFLNLAPEKSLAGTTDNVSGWAWSENIGWVSFNCTGVGSCGTVDYGVRVNTQSGDFSGYAWSENIGWVKFNPQSGYPGQPTNGVKLSMGNNQVSGWARACTAVADKTTCEGAADPAAGGWDGWIKMRCQGSECGSSNYGVLYNPSTKEFSGWAWSDMVVGWISFNCSDSGVCGTSNYKVLAQINNPPVPGTPPTLTANPSTLNPGNGTCSQTTVLGWSYFDPDGNPQQASQYQVDEASQGDFATPVLDRTLGAVTSATLTHGVDLSYGGSWVWRVRVQDNQGMWSNWVQATGSFSTIPHALPSVNFGFSPAKPSVNEPVNFTDQSSTSDSDRLANLWAWTFQNGNPATSTVKNPSGIKFTSKGSKTVSLTATDEDSHACTLNRTVSVQVKLPRFRELLPF